MLYSEIAIDLDRKGPCQIHEAEVGKWLKDNCNGLYRTIERGNIYPEPSLQSLTSSKLSPGVKRVCLYSRVYFDLEEDAIAFRLWLDART